VTTARESGSVVKVAWLPLVFVFWANVHIQFVLGWGVLGLACLLPGAASRWRFVLLTASCMAATLVNPYGPGLFVVIWEYTAESKALVHVQEMQPPSPLEVGSVVTAGVWLWAGRDVIRRRPVDWFHVALLLSGAFFAVRTQRDLWFGLLTAVAVLRGPVCRLIRWEVPATVAGVFLVVRTVAAIGGLQNTTEPDRYPMAAVSHVRANDYPGPLFNDFNWGGYLIWALPEYPVSIDGRTNVYGDARLFTAYRTWEETDAWRDDKDFARANLIVGPVERPELGLVRSLRSRPDWRLVYEDDVSVVFVRRR
jgi:hypothetical protein